MFKTITSIWIMIWPPARRRDRAAEAVRERAVAEAREQAKIAAKEEEERKAAAQHLQAYHAHVQAVDLNGIVTRNGHPLKLSMSQCDGDPLEPSELNIEVSKRIRLATNAKRDLQIRLADKMSDKEIAAITSKLDQTALNWLWRHNDPEGQRKAAKAIFRAFADFDEVVTFDHYIMIVAESVARSRAKMRPSRILVAVGVRAILLRSADSRWTRTRRSELRPLSKPHW